MPTTILGVHVERTNDHGYPATLISVSSGTVRALADALAGTIDNREGYGSAEACASVAARCRAAIEAGYTYEYDYDLYTGFDLRIRYQHYGDNGSFCAPTIEYAGTRPETLQRSAAFLRSIGGSGSRCQFPASPDALLDRVRRYAHANLIRSERGPDLVACLGPTRTDGSLAKCKVWVAPAKRVSAA